ncbi:hypothetical protein MKX03_008518 [Papaver bracteatum]|nr:hypothetical protein MKX03_008518 [Papaver bracteatum]
MVFQAIESEKRTSFSMTLSKAKSKNPIVKHTNYEQSGGQRIATMLMYLSDNVEGGDAGIGKCSYAGKMLKGASVKPIKGDAVLFWNVGLDGEVDPKSMHTGCEVLSGEKWSAIKLMRQNKYY